MRVWFVSNISMRRSCSFNHEKAIGFSLRFCPRRNQYVFCGSSLRPGNALIIHLACVLRTASEFASQIESKKLSDLLFLLCLIARSTWMGCRKIVKKAFSRRFWRWNLHSDIQNTRQKIKSGRASVDVELSFCNHTFYHPTLRIIYSKTILVNGLQL